MPYSRCCLTKARFVYSTSPHLQVACYKYRVISRITQSAFLTLVAMSLMWPVSSVSARDTTLMEMESGMTSQQQPHSMSSEDDLCASPDCASHADCPINMSTSNCDLSGSSCLTCSVSGMNVLMCPLDGHRFRRSIVIDFPNPLRLTSNHRSIGIYHPPRFS